MPFAVAPALFVLLLLGIRRGLDGWGLLVFVEGCIRRGGVGKSYVSRGSIVRGERQWDGLAEEGCFKGVKISCWAGLRRGFGGERDRRGGLGSGRGCTEAEVCGEKRREKLQ